MAFLPPVIMEIRAQAAQFFATVDKVATATQGMADETVAAADGMATKATASADRMGAAVAASAEAMAARTSAETEGMAARVTAEIETMATDGAAGAEGMATKVTASIEEMAAAVYHGMTEMTAQTSAAMAEQSASVVRAQEANTVAVTKAADIIAAADARAAAAAEETATATKAAGLQMQASFERTAVSAVSSMGTVTSAFAGAALKQVEAAKGAEANLMGIANGITKVAVVAGLAIAGVGLDMAAHFEKSTMLLVTAGGESMDALDRIREGILKISTETGTSAEQMSEGMYVMEKAGFRGAAGLAALKASAQGAKDENVSLAIMSQAVTDVLLDYGYKMDTAAHATDSSVRVTNMLVAASGAAKTTMEDFANSMAAVVPIASTAKIGFDQVGGAIATMTQHGQTAQQSSQNLANLIQSLVRPNNLASAAMSQLGIDTTDLAQNLGQRGLSGTLAIVDQAIKSHTKDGMVFTGTMKDNANAAKAMDTVMGQMSPTLAKMSQGLKDGSVSQKDYTKDVKNLGGEAGALGNQFLSLYKANSGVTDSLKAGKPAYETYGAALRDVLGNVTAARAAQMLLMNDSAEFTRNIKAIGDAGKKSGQDISTWADMQKSLSVQLDQSKAMVTNLAIELGTKLMPAAKGTLTGFTDLVHGFEEGNPVLLGIATLIGGMVTASVVNFGISMGKTAVSAISSLVDIGASAIGQSQLFVAGMTADEIAVGQFATKAELAGAKVKGMTGMLTGAAVGLTAVALAAHVLQPQLDSILKPTGETADALQRFGGEAAKGAFGADTLSKSFQDLVEHKDGISDFQQALKGIADPEITGNIDNVLTGGIKALSLGLIDVKSTSEEARSRFKDMGQQIASMDATKAVQAFAAMAAQTDGSKDSLTHLLEYMPAYKDQLAQQAEAAGMATDNETLLEIALGKVAPAADGAAGAVATFKDATGAVKPITPALQKSLDDAGVSADGLAVDLGKVLDGMLATGMATESSRSATEAFNKVINDTDTAVKDVASSGVDMSKALNKSKTDFDLTSAAGAALNDKFTAVKDKGLEVAKSMVGQGKDSVSGALVETYNNMLKAADAMGIHGQAAVDLTRNLLGIPKNVDVKTWVDSAAAQAAADNLHTSVDNIPSVKSVTFVISAQGERALVDKFLGIPGAPASIAAPVPKALGGLLSRAGGGIVGYAGGGSPLLDVGPGGLLSGPGTGTSDDILARVSNGEFVIRQAMVQRYGLPFMNALNSGTFPGPAALNKASIGPVAPVQVPQLPYTKAGNTTTTNTKTVTNHVTVSMSAADPRRAASELGSLLQQMS